MIKSMMLQRQVERFFCGYVLPATAFEYEKVSPLDWTAGDYSKHAWTLFVQSSLILGTALN